MFTFLRFFALKNLNFLRVSFVRLRNTTFDRKIKKKKKERYVPNVILRNSYLNVSFPHYAFLNFLLWRDLLRFKCSFLHISSGIRKRSSFFSSRQCFGSCWVLKWLTVRMVITDRSAAVSTIPLSLTNETRFFFSFEPSKSVVHVRYGERTR